MKISRKVQLWLADRHPAFDRPSIYRRAELQPSGPTVSGWDAVLIGMISVILICIGIGAIVAGLFLTVVIVMTVLGL